MLAHGTSGSRASGVLPAGRAGAARRRVVPGRARAPSSPWSGPNGAGKTTLLRLIAGELQPHGGTVTVSGGLGVMRQFVGLGPGRAHRPGPAGLRGAAADPGRPRRPSTRPSTAIMTRRRRGRPDAVRAGAQRLGGGPRLRGRDRSGTCARWPRSACRTRRRSGAQVRTLSRRRAEAAGAGGAAARPRRGAAARRAGQLPGRAGQAVAGGAAEGDPQDRAVRLPRPGAAGPGRREDRQRRAAARPAPTSGCTAAASAPTTRRARSGSRASRSCAAAGTRSTPS